MARCLVTCQEVGHTFGLDHRDENFDNGNLGTCMDYTNDPGTRFTETHRGPSPSGEGPLVLVRVRPRESARSAPVRS